MDLGIIGFDSVPKMAGDFGSVRFPFKPLSDRTAASLL